MTIITRQEIIDSLVCRRSCGHYSTSIDDPDPDCDCGKVIIEDNRNEQFISLAEHEEIVAQYVDEAINGQIKIMSHLADKKDNEHRQALEEINNWINNELKYESTQKDSRAKGYFNALYKVQYKFISKYLEGDKNDKE